VQYYPSYHSALFKNCQEAVKEVGQWGKGEYRVSESGGRLTQSGRRPG
jgi:hypothetical protein